MAFNIGTLKPIFDEYTIWSDLMDFTQMQGNDLFEETDV